MSSAHHCLLTSHQKERQTDVISDVLLRGKERPQSNQQLTRAWALSGVSNAAQMAGNAAQHKTVNFLKTL